MNGSVIGFFFIYFLPSILHIRCLYFSKNKISSEDLAKLQDKDDDSVIVSRKNTTIQRVEMSEYRKSNEDSKEEKTLGVPDAGDQTAKPFTQENY